MWLRVKAIMRSEVTGSSERANPIMAVPTVSLRGAFSLVPLRKKRSMMNEKAKLIAMHDLLHSQWSAYRRRVEGAASACEQLQAPEEKRGWRPMVGEGDSTCMVEDSSLSFGCWLSDCRA